MRWKKPTLKQTAAAFALIFAFCAGGVFAVSQTSFLADTAKNYAKPMLEKKLQADFVSAPFYGNPVTGYYVKNAVLRRNGEDLLTADEMKITLSFSGTVKKHTPKLKLEATGVKTSLDKFNRLIPHTNTPGPSNIILSEVFLKNSLLDTPFGVLGLDNSSINIGNSQTYSVDISGKIDGKTPFAAAGGIRKADGNWTADNLKLTLDNGTASADGALYPKQDVSLAADKLNLGRIADMFPQVRRLGIRGILTTELSLKGSGRRLETEGSMALENAVIRGIPLEAVTVGWSFKNRQLNAVFNKDGRADSALTGTVKFDGIKKYLDADISTQKVHLAVLSKQLKEQLGSAKILPQGTISGAKIKLKGPLNALTGNIALLPSDITYGTLSFRNLKGTAVFDGKACGNVNFSTVHNGKPVTLTGVLAFADNVRNDLKFSAAGFRLEELYDCVPALKKANIKGAVALNASVSGMIRALKLNAKLASPQITADKIGTIADLNLDGNYLLNNGNIELNKFSAVWNGAKVNAAGNIDSTKHKPELKIAGRISNMQTERFFSLLKFMDNINLKTAIDGDFKVSGALSNPLAEANLRAGHGTLLKGLELDSASSVVRYKNNKITAEPLTLSTPHGTLQSRAESIVRGGTNWSWEAEVDGLAMRVINGIFGMHEDINGRMSGKIRLYSIGQGMHWTGNFVKSRFLWRTFHFDSFTGTAYGTKDLINIDHMKFEICGGSGIADGKVTIGKTLSTSMIDAKLDASKINIYEVTRRHLPQVRNIQGLIQTKCKITGSISEPLFSGRLKFSPLRIGTAYIPELNAFGDAGLDHINCKKIIAQLPEGHAEGSASLKKTENGWHAAANLKGSEIEASSLLRFASDSTRAALKGKINATVECDCPLNELMVKGTLKSEEFTVKGLKIQNFSAPFYYSDKYFMVEDLNCSTNGGSLSGGLAYDTSSDRWGASCNVKNVSIDRAFKDVFGNVQGKITGKADLKMRVGGMSFNLGSLSAAGILTAADGEISGFKFLDSIKKFTKNKPLRFKKAQTTFRYDNETLILLPGTQAAAPDGDPVYRMFMTDGYITRKGDMSITCLGKFNIRALNSLLGGITGLVDMSRTITTHGINNVDTKELLQNVLGGVLGGATRSSFRYVSLGLGGNISKPKLTKLIVESDARRRSKGTTIPTSNSDPDEKQMKMEGDWTFKLHFEVPVGYGKNTEANDFKGQFMQDTLKSLISNINF